MTDDEVLKEKWTRLLEKNATCRSIESLPNVNLTKDAVTKFHSLTIQSIAIPNPQPPAYHGLSHRYSASITFFHAPSKAFYGSTYTGKQCDEQNEGDQTISMNEMVHWWSKYSADSYIVIEIIATKICLRSGMEQGRYGYGWSFIPLKRDDDDSSGIVVPESSPRKIPIYEGSPRKLLYVGSGYHDLEEWRKTLPVSNEELTYLFLSKSITEKDIQYAQDSFIIGHKEAIPGSISYGKGCSILTLSRFTVPFGSQDREEIEKMAITSVMGVDSLHAKCKASDKKSTFLQFSKKNKGKKNQAARVSSYHLKFAVHNSHVALSSTAVELQVDENGDLSHEGPFTLEHYYEDHLCAIVCNLECTVYIPSSSKTSGGKTATVGLGYQVYFPFDTTVEGTRQKGGGDVVDKTAVLSLSTADQRLGNIFSSVDSQLPLHTELSVKFNLNLVEEIRDGGESNDDAGDEMVETHNNEQIDEVSFESNDNEGINESKTSHEDGGEMNICLNKEAKEHKPLTEGKGEIRDLDLKTSHESKTTSQERKESDMINIQNSHKIRGETNLLENRRPVLSSEAKDSFPNTTVSSQTRIVDTTVEPSVESRLEKALARSLSDTAHEPSSDLLLDSIETNQVEKAEIELCDNLLSDIFKEETKACKLSLSIESIGVQSDEPAVFCSFQLFNSAENRTHMLPTLPKMITHVHESITDFEEGGRAKENMSTYLQKKFLNVDVWSSNSMMYIGKLSVRVRSLLGKAATHFPLYQGQATIGESGKIDLRTAGEACGEIKLSLHVEIINELVRKEDCVTTRGDHDKNEDIENYASQIELNNEWKIVLKEALAMKMEGQRTGLPIRQSHERTFQGDSSMSSIIARSLFFLKLMENSYDGNFQDKMVESLMIEWCRQERKNKLIQQHLEDQITQKLSVKARVGEALYIELRLVNAKSHPMQLNFLLGGGNGDLRVATGSAAQDIRSMLSPVAVIGMTLDSEEIVQETPCEVSPGTYSVLIQPGKFMVVPIIFQASTLTLSRKEILIDVNEVASKNLLVARYCIGVEISLPFPDRTFNLIGAKHSDFSRTITGSKPFTEMTIRCISAGPQQSVACEKSNEMTIKSNCGDATNSHDFLLVFYSNQNMFVIEETWKFCLHGYDKILQDAAIGQWTSYRLLIEEVPRSAQYAFFTSDNDHIIVNPQTLRPVFGASNEVKVSFNFDKAGKHFFIVNMVTKRQIVRGWLFHVTVK